MEPEGSLPHSLMPATCPYPESQLDPVHTPTSTSWRSILILSSHLRLCCLFPSGFPTKTPYTPLLGDRGGTVVKVLCYKSVGRWFGSPIALHAPPISFFSVLSTEKLGEQYRSLSSSLCSILHSPVTSSLLGPNIILNTLFSNTLSLRSSLNVSHQVSYPYKTTGKIIVLYILLLIFWIASWWQKILYRMTASTLWLQSTQKNTENKISTHVTWPPVAMCSCNSSMTALSLSLSVNIYSLCVYQSRVLIRLGYVTISKYVKMMLQANNKLYIWSPWLNI